MTTLFNDELVDLALVLLKLDIITFEEYWHNFNIY
jgi:hypothetical protein